MDQKILDIIRYVNLIGLCLIVFSCFRMLHYLCQKGFEKSSLYSLNVFFLTKYIKLTRAENGKVGVWFKVFLIAVALTIVSGILTELFTIEK